MKTYKAILILFLVCFIGTEAQVRTGFIGGLNFSEVKQSSANIPDLDGITTFEIGAIIDIPVSQSLSVYLEPMYINKGTGLGVQLDGINIGDNNINIGSVDLGLDLELSSIEIPVFLKYEFDNKYIRPYFLGGAVIGFNTNSKLKLSAFGLGYSTDIDDFTESIEYGLSFGGGINIPIDQVIISIEGRYTFGLNNVVKTNKLRLPSNLFDDGDVLLDDFEIKTRSAQVMLGISFPILIEN